MIIFLASTLVSFIGSLQLGPVNLFVINATLNDSKKSSFYIAFGGCIPEFIYCSIAIFSYNFLQLNECFFFLFNFSFLTILLIIGLIFFFKKNEETFPKQKSLGNTKPILLFLKGFSLAALNPQLLPFWIYVQLQFNSVKPLRIISNLNKISFVIGAGIGSLLLLVCFIFAVTKYKETFLKYLNNKHYYKVLSLLFLILASHQIWLLFLKEDH